MLNIIVKYYQALIINFFIDIDQSILINFMFFIALIQIFYLI